MDIQKICKALANDTRRRILVWLRNPGENFPPQGESLAEPVDLRGGVCVSSIQEKARVSQSTMSTYLDILLQAELVESERHGKWTYFRRNEATIQAFAQYIREKL